MYATISWTKDFSCVHDLTHRSYRYMFVCLFVPLSVVIWHLTTLATDNRVDDAVVNRLSKLANRGDFSNSIYLFYNAPSNLDFFPQEQGEPPRCCHSLVSCSSPTHLTRWCVATMTQEWHLIEMYSVNIWESCGQEFSVLFFCSECSAQNWQHVRDVVSHLVPGYKLKCHNIPVKSCVLLQNTSHHCQAVLCKTNDICIKCEFMLSVQKKSRICYRNNTTYHQQRIISNTLWLYKRKQANFF